MINEEKYRGGYGRWIWGKREEDREEDGGKREEGLG